MSNEHYDDRAIQDTFGFSSPKIDTSANTPYRRPVNPAMKVRASLKWITPDVRAEVDNWLMDRFGAEPVVITDRAENIYCHSSLCEFFTFHRGNLLRKLWNDT